MFTVSLRSFVLLEELSLMVPCKVARESRHDRVA
jgi:hypothetical protein